MSEVTNNQTGVVAVLARQADGVSAAATGDIGSIDANRGRAIGGADESAVLSIGLVDVGHIAVGRISALGLC